MDLDYYGLVESTDKSRLVHDYLRQYERILAPFADREFTLLEIGVHNGASLRVWERRYPLANIAAIDIEPSVKRFERDRVAIEVGSQADGPFLESVCAKYSPDVVIDDGSHIPDHQIFSFEAIWPHVRPGGVYIVEDVAMHDPTDRAFAYFAEVGPNTLRGTGPSGVAGVEYISGAVAVRKKAPDALDLNVERLEELVQRSAIPYESYSYLGRYITRHRASIGDPHELRLKAIACAERSIALNDNNNPWAHVDLSRLFLEEGDLDRAVLEAEIAVRTDLAQSAFIRQNLSSVREEANKRRV